ncbi:MAG: hypothetical protein IJA94_06215 [Bacilli bacterium]|nr:hypothetical protein [Bacilli bacterium]
MTDNLLQQYLEDYKIILTNVLNTINHRVFSATKRFNEEELVLMEQDSYVVNGKVLDDLNRINYETQKIITYLNDNIELDIESVRFCKSCLEEIKKMINDNNLNGAKQILTIVQVVLGFTTSFYSVFLDIAKVLNNMKLARKKKGDVNE